MRGPYYRILLAQAYAHAGNIDEGLKCLSEALRIREQSGESWTDAEIHRIKGDLLLRKNDTSAAELSYQRAVSIAADQGARSFELRSAMSLSRLWKGQKRHDRFAACLQKTLAKFGKNFDSSDLQEARSLLNDLSHRKAR